MSDRFLSRALLVLLLGSASAGAACTDTEEQAGPPDMDAALPSDDAGSAPDARPPLDAAADASRDAAVELDAANPYCHAASRETCVVDEPRSVTRFDITCSGATPVRCLHYGLLTDAGIESGPACVANVELCKGYAQMSFAFECDDANDCPRGQYCYSWAPNPSYFEGSRCVPDCVDPGYVAYSSQHLCKQDCECGKQSRCDTDGVCRGIP